MESLIFCAVITPSVAASVFYYLSSVLTFPVFHKWLVTTAWKIAF